MNVSSQFFMRKNQYNVAMFFFKYYLYGLYSIRVLLASSWVEFELIYPASICLSIGTRVYSFIEYIFYSNDDFEVVFHLNATQVAGGF